MLSTQEGSARDIRRRRERNLSIQASPQDLLQEVKGSLDLQGAEVRDVGEDGTVNRGAMRWSERLFGRMQGLDTQSVDEKETQDDSVRVCIPRDWPSSSVWRAIYVSPAMFCQLAQATSGEEKTQGPTGWTHFVASETWPSFLYPHLSLSLTAL